MLARYRLRSRGAALAQRLLHLRLGRRARRDRVPAGVVRAVGAGVVNEKPVAAPPVLPAYESLSTLICASSAASATSPCPPLVMMWK